MKKTRLLLVLLMLLFVTTLTAFAADNDVTVKIDAEFVEFDVQPTIHNGRTMVPLRKIFEALGATVEWDDPSRTVTSTKGNTTIKVKIDSTTMTVNGKSVTLDVPAMIIGGRTLVPVRAISESFGCQVGWDGNSRMVSIINDKINFTMLYAKGDRSRVIANNEVDKYLKVGWYRDAKLTDNLTDEQIFNKLKTRADTLAFSCAETALRNFLKNPSTMTVLNRSIYDQDNYFRYVILIKAQSQNGFGGYVTDHYYITLRLDPSLNGMFTYSQGGILGIKFSPSDDVKNGIGWGTKPADFDAAISAKKNQKAEVVSVKQIIAFPEKYEGKYVTIKETLMIGGSYLRDKYFNSYTLDDRGDPISGAEIDVYYTLSENMEECILAEEYAEFTVTGYVKTYSNSTEAYIDADIITFK